MSLFNSLGGGGQQQVQPVNPQQAFSELKANPVGVLGQIGLNVPSGMNNPQQILNHLRQTGQIPQSRIAQAFQMMGQMGRR